MALTAPAQTSVRQRQSSVAAGPNRPSAGAAAEAGGDLKRIDLDFPGGTPDQLVAAISKALGHPLNAIIPNEQKDTKIMPIKVFGVTVPELFSALESASATQRAIVTGKNMQFQNVALGFRPNTNNVTEQTVWSFYSTAPTAEYLAATSNAVAPEQVCQYFQLAPYLENRSIEDITTAIQTGWKMLKVEPAPQLSFHQETKLLIAVGYATHIAQIPLVLEQLQRDDTAAVEKIAQWLEEITMIETKKEPGWDQKAQELKHKIQKVAVLQRAREEIKQASVPVPGRNFGGRPQ